MLFLADAAAAAALAAGAAILGLYASGRRRRHEYAALLSAASAAFRTLRPAVRTEQAMLLGFGVVVGVATGFVAALVDAAQPARVHQRPPAAVLSYYARAAAGVVMLVVAVAVLDDRGATWPAARSSAGSASISCGRHRREYYGGAGKSGALRRPGPGRTGRPARR